MKIAFVKQDVYQDLYVNGRRCDPADLLFSSIVRVGPLGLFTELHADFHIVREDDAPECRTWEKLIPHGRPEWYRMLRDRRITETPFPEARFFQPGSPLTHAAFAVGVDEIDWGQYDVVIGINFAIPRRIVARHRSVLWCYLIGEANTMLDRVHHGYDVSLNQETRGLIARQPGIVDFPYTFVGPHCLEKIMHGALARPSERHGIFIEVNSVQSRPAQPEPHLAPLLATGHPLRMHRQNIRANLTELYDARYFVKTGGRFIRGNSVIEAISCGALVLMDPAQVHHSQLLPRETWVYSAGDAARRIAELDRHPDEYRRLQDAQRALVQLFVMDAPLESLKNCLRFKRNTPPSPRRSVFRRLAAKLSGATRGALRLR